MVSDIAIMTRGDTPYVRELVACLVEANRPPKVIFFLSRAGRLWFKYRSFQRISKQLGLIEAVRRIRRREPRSLTPKTLPSVHTLAEMHNVRIVDYDYVNQGRVLTELAGLHDPLVLLAGAGLVRSGIVRLARGGCLNAHPAPLPGLRGVDVIAWALAEGHELGISVHEVVEKVDAGTVVQTEALDVRAEEEYGDFLDRAIETQARTLATAVLDYHGDVTRQAIPQTPEILGPLKRSAPAHVHRAARAAYDRLRDSIAAL